MMKKAGWALAVIATGKKEGRSTTTTRAQE